MKWVPAWLFQYRSDKRLFGDTPFWARAPSRTSIFIENRGESQEQNTPFVRNVELFVCCLNARIWGEYCNWCAAYDLLCRGGAAAAVECLPVAGRDGPQMQTGIPLWVSFSMPRTLDIVPTGGDQSSRSVFSNGSVMRSREWRAMTRAAVWEGAWPESGRRRSNLCVGGCDFRRLIFGNLDFGLRTRSKRRGGTCRPNAVGSALD